MAGEENFVIRENYSKIIEGEWELLNFRKFPHNKGECLKSPSFVLGDATYNVVNYPMGFKRDADQVWFSLFLSKVSGSDEQNVSFSFALKTGSLILAEVKDDHKFKGNGKGYGAEHFFKISSLLEAIKSTGALTIIFMVSLRDSLDKIVRRGGFEDLSERFKELFLNGHQTDVKLKVRGKDFDVHKLILGARSPVFNAMFQHEMTETNSGVVEISDLDPEHFKDFLLFVYTGNYDHVTPTNALGLYKAADKYDLKNLRKECSQQMISGLSVDNILDVILLAVTHEETELLDFATNYFIENSELIFVTEKWKTFLIENTEMANDLLVKLAKTCKAVPKT